jgi:hypothetical protein
MRIHSLREPVASIFCAPNQGKKEEYTFASKISYTVLRKKERKKQGVSFSHTFIQEEVEYLRMKLLLPISMWTYVDEA